MSRPGDGPPPPAVGSGAGSGSTFRLFEAWFGGSAGSREPGLVDPAVAWPMATFGGVYLDDDLFLMATAYLLHLAKGHPFVDADKRVGLVTAPSSSK